MNERIEAADRMAAFAGEGRLIQRGWHDARDGRELACLLGAIGPDVTSPRHCPADVMPSWMAHLLTVLFDNVRPDQAADFGARFAAALRAKPVDDAVRDRWLVRVVEFAREADAAYEAHAAVEAVADPAWEAEAAYVAEWTAANAAWAHAAADAAVAAYVAEWAADAEARTAAYETMFAWLIEEMEA